MALTANAALATKFEWEAAPSIRTPELGATFARLEFWVGDECVSRVEDTESGASRRAVYVSMYPLAEWIAEHWWLLSAHVRPSLLGTAAWTYKNRGRVPAAAFSWLQAHNVRGAGDGFAWPDLSILPEGSRTRLAWFRDAAISPSRAVRFLSQGEATAATDDVLSALQHVVQATLARLDEVGIAGTRLQDEWQALQDLSEEEREFCVSSARLGLDPFWVPDEVAEFLHDLDASMEEQLVDDFLASVPPARLGAAKSWVDNASDALQAWPGWQASQESLLDKLAGELPEPIRHGLPWRDGYAHANLVRHALAIDPTDGVAAADLVPTYIVEPDLPFFFLDGLGAKVGAGPRLIMTRERGPSARRFAQARAVWHALVDDGRFLLSDARTDRQAAGRAFAAELLAPASGISELLASNPLEVTQGELESLAEHFSVDRLVIEHQIQNQL